MNRGQPRVTSVSRRTQTKAETHVKERKLWEEKAASAVIFAIVNFAAEFRGLQIHHRNNTTALHPKGILVTSFKQKA